VLHLNLFLNVLSSSEVRRASVKVHTRFEQSFVEIFIQLLKDSSCVFDNLVSALELDI
jgi:hypothetical protein